MPGQGTKVTMSLHSYRKSSQLEYKLAKQKEVHSDLGRLAEDKLGRAFQLKLRNWDLILKAIVSHFEEVKQGCYVIRFCFKNLWEPC